jgi:serine palmitoyltransferase
VESIPGSAIVINYIKNSYQNDPFRVVLELLLAIYAVKYMMSKKYRIDHTHIPLTEKVKRKPAEHLLYYQQRDQQGK